MHKILTLFTICFVSFCLQANGQAAALPEPLQLFETSHDFGKIAQGKPVYYSFEISNTGLVAVKIDDIHATCGCTTPEWSREPIKPGETTKIKVGYNAAAEGPFEKYITLTYNQNITKQLKITGTVWKAPEGSAPVNASIQLLKQKNQ